MNEVKPDLVIKRTNLAGSQIDNEMVFFNHQTGKYFATGPVGAEIWAYLDSPRSLSQIYEHLLEMYEVDRSTCETQVKSFVTELIQNGIVASEEQTF